MDWDQIKDKLAFPVYCAFTMCIFIIDMFLNEKKLQELIKKRISPTYHKMHASQDVQEFQRDVAFDQLSSTSQQACREVMSLNNELINEYTIEETLKQNANVFIQNLGQISNPTENVKNKRTNINSEDTDKNNSLSPQKTRTEMGELKGEEFIKLKERGSIITARRHTIFVTPKLPAKLGTSMLHLRRKTLGLDIPEIPIERPESPPIPIIEDIRPPTIELEIPPIDLFTPLEIAAISCVLEECLEQLLTIRFMIPTNVDPRWDETYKTINEMYGIPDEAKIIFREDMGLLPLVPTAAEKMQRDRTYVYKVLERVLYDIRNNRRFDSLQEEIDNITRKQEEEHDLETSARVWFAQAKQLRERLEYNKTVNEKNAKRTIKLAQESDAQVDHAIFVNSGKLGYAEKWAKARLEQQDVKLQLQRTDLLNKLDDYSKEYNIEQIISAEMDAYLRIDIEEKEKQIVMWTIKYNTELVERQQEIDELKEKVEKQKLEINEMRFSRDKQEELINACIIEERRLREEVEEINKLNRAAIIIQAAWKGYMVRHELGKYKNLRKRLKKRKRKKKKIKAKK